MRSPAAAPAPRTAMLKLSMYASSVPSGDGRFAFEAPVAPPPRPPRPPPATPAPRVHWYSVSVQFQFALSAAKEMLRRSSANVNVVNGSATAVTGLCIAVPIAAASRSASNAGRFSGTAASTSTNALPPFTDLRYQNRLVPPIHTGGSGESTTSGW